MTLNLLLFAITFTIFLEIEFDLIFYEPYRSEKISPVVNSLHIAQDKDIKLKWNNPIN